MHISQKVQIPTIQLTDQMKLKKKEGPNVDTSIPLRKRNKIIKGGRGREGPRWERGGDDKREQDLEWGETAQMNSGPS